jgi:alpha-tubulin suppressor-like RCC1 family protein
MNQGEVWCPGETSTEVYQNIGAADFPFERIPGAFLDIGIESAESLATKDNSIFWLDNNKRVRRAGGPLGYNSTVISTPAMDEEIAGYGETGDAEGFTFSQGGHDFYALTFPSVPKTWVYDITSSAQLKDNFWHERISGTLNRWIARCYAEFKGLQIFGDYREGKIYAAKDGHLRDHGLFLTRRYLGPVIRKDRERIYFRAFEVEIQSVEDILHENMAAGGLTSVVIRGGGTTWTWGRGNSGALGDLTATTKSSPVSVVGSHSFVEVSTGLDYCCGLKSNGEVWSWGEGGFGNLGDNTTTDKSSPVLVVGSHSFIEISCGDTQAYALKADGSIWAWGEASSGRLGNNSITDRSSPVSVVGSHSFSQVSAGEDHCVGLKMTTGQAWAWGVNTNGELGDNTTAHKSSPVSVVGAHSFTQISGGGDFTLALKADGSTWAWGRALQGQLGDNSKTTKSSPVSVVGSHSFVKVSAGGDFSVGLKSNGEVWTWGQNSAGECGDNTLSDRSSPVSVVGNHSFVDIAAATSGSYTLARKASGQTWGWGLNTTGELGDGTATNRSSPVQVVHSFGANAILDWKNEHKQWSSEHTLTIPTPDNYVRTRLRRLGQARSRQFRVTVTDPVKPIIKAAYVDIDGEDED